MQLCAKTIKQAIAGREAQIYGAYGVSIKRRHIRCPFPDHDDRHPSFRIDPATDRFYCTCESGDVFQFVQRMEGCGFYPALQRVVEIIGGVEVGYTPKPEPSIEPYATKPNQRALKLWQESEPASYPIAQRYAEARGIKTPLPQSIRFHLNCHHRETGREHPALICGIQSAENKLIAVHRIYLSDQGAKAAIKPNKSTLGKYRGGAVRLAAAAPDKALLIGEGVETMLSVQQATNFPCWAALGSNLKGVVVPDYIRHVMICADNGAAGLNAANVLAERLQHKGKVVRIVAPTERHSDFNDVLKEGIA